MPRAPEPRAGHQLICVRASGLTGFCTHRYKACFIQKFRECVFEGESTLWETKGIFFHLRHVCNTFPSREHIPFVLKNIFFVFFTQHILWLTSQLGKLSYPTVTNSSFTAATLRFCFSWKIRDVLFFETRNIRLRFAKSHRGVVVCTINVLFGAKLRLFLHPDSSYFSPLHWELSCTISRCLKLPGNDVQQIDWNSLKTLLETSR